MKIKQSNILNCRRPLIVQLSTQFLIVVLVGLMRINHVCGNLHHSEIILPRGFDTCSSNTSLDVDGQFCSLGEIPNITKRVELVLEYSPVDGETSARELTSAKRLDRWERGSVIDALEFLSRKFQANRLERDRAVETLAQASDDELIAHLMQLVQALRYESPELLKFAFENDRNEILANGQKPSFTPNVSNSLALLLIHRASRNIKLGSYFWWNLRVELENTTQLSAHYSNFKLIDQHFLFVISQTPELQSVPRAIARQTDFVQDLVNLTDRLTAENGTRLHKQDILRRILSNPDTEINKLIRSGSLFLPLDPETLITGIRAEHAVVFKSYYRPILLQFQVQRQNIESNYSVIFKPGADLRTDQLVLQIIGLMDKILKEHIDLDLCLTPYKVLPVGLKHGFIQVVHNASRLFDLIDQHESIQNFLRLHSADETAPYGIRRAVMDAYVKSCAGYCLITYLLGVGDRDYDNILLVPHTGRMFHVDLQHIVDRFANPKMIIKPRAMPITRDLVDAMGGENSAFYSEFKRLVQTAYVQLRRNANKIFNLFELLMDSGLPDIAADPKAALKFVKDRFQLDLREEEAKRHISSVIDGNLHSKHGEQGVLWYKILQKQIRKEE